ncbi:MAG: hypothetical protein Q4C50_09715, partial [Eubacteriales bacterium]|nr:hypothetical protein [Eubacteriales bacterium]
TRQEETSQEETQPRETQSVSLAVVQSNTKKLQQFKELVEDIVEKVVRENNEELQRRIENSISRETEYLLHMQEQREEERFRRLDEAIRAHQRSSREVAAARERRFLWKWIK